MSETQFSWSQFPQYTEEQLKRASKSFKSSVNWAKYKEWVEAGKPFKEHNELLSIDQADQKLENSSYNRPVGKSIIEFVFILLSHFYVYIWLIINFFLRNQTM